jgi:hypothetical protein
MESTSVDSGDWGVEIIVSSGPRTRRQDLAVMASHDTQANSIRKKA